MSENNATPVDASLSEAWANPEKLPDRKVWLQEMRDEAAQSQYAFLILKKHFARAGAEIKHSETPTTWYQFNWLLYLNTDTWLHEGSHAALLRNLWAELVAFCCAIPDEFSTYRLLGMLEKFVDRDPSRSLILPLLPDAALDRLDEINEMLSEQHEDYLRRLDQMGY